MDFHLYMYMGIGSIRGRICYSECK